MNTKFDVGETIYIPAKVIAIRINNAGIIYKTDFKDAICLKYEHGADVPEDLMVKIPDDLYIEIQKRLNPKEFVEPKG